MDLNASLSLGPVLVDNKSFISCKDAARVGEMDSTSVGIWDLPRRVPLPECQVNYS